MGNMIEQNETVTEELATIEETNALANSGAMTFEQRKSALNSLTNFQSIWDLLDTANEVTVNVVNVLEMPIEQTDKRTGEVYSATRCIFVDENGAAFATASKVVKNNVDIMLAVLGMPETWESAVKCVFTKVKGKTGDYFINLSF